MLRFDPPELEGEIADAIRAWTRLLSLDLQEFTEDVIDTANVDFDASEHDDKTITLDSRLTFFLPDCDDIVEMTCQQFTELARESSSAVLIENRECWTDERLLALVEPRSKYANLYQYYMVPEAETDEEEQVRRQLIEQRARTAALGREFKKMSDQEVRVWLEESDKTRELSSKLGKKLTKRYCTTRANIDGQEILCSLTRGFTIFGVLIAAAGNYDEDYPPMGEEDMFVELRYDHKLPEDVALSLVEAYMFELSSNLRIDLARTVYPDIQARDPDQDGQDLTQLERRFRPLLVGRGLFEVLRIYNSAAASSEPEIQILFFTKVFEYVSQTVVKEESNQAIRAKLLSPRALEPDSDFISELQALVEKQRTFQKDKEAIKLTACACCEASELAKLAPSFLEELKCISITSKPKEKIEALRKLGSVLYATRNSIVHAKANYEPTGEECPEGELPQFVQCLKLAAQQVIRWYHTRPENMRVA